LRPLFMPEILFVHPHIMMLFENDEIRLKNNALTGFMPHGGGVLCACEYHSQR